MIESMLKHETSSHVEDHIKIGKQTMTFSCTRGFIGAFLLAFLVMTLVPMSMQANSSRREDRLIADLASPESEVVENALLKLEKEFPNSTRAFPTIKQLLTDSREQVRRKAARVLGVLHAEVDRPDIKNICAMFKAKDPLEVMDALKSLRGLKAEDPVPEILPLLQHRHPGVLKDACRTLAVFGSKKDIPAIEPLLNHQDEKVQMDARDAIFVLQSKP